jgi:hypothetical protein
MECHGRHGNGRKLLICEFPEEAEIVDLAIGPDRATSANVKPLEVV